MRNSSNHHCRNQYALDRGMKMASPRYGPQSNKSDEYQQGFQQLAGYEPNQSRSRQDRKKVDKDKEPILQYFNTGCLLSIDRFHFGGNIFCYNFKFEHFPNPFFLKDRVAW